MGVPIALFIAGRVSLRQSFLVLYPGRNLSAVCHAVGAAAACSCHSVLRTERTEQAMVLLCVRGFGCSGFEETGRLIAMVLDEEMADFPNALMYGIGHGGLEPFLIGGLSGISNLVSMLMINSGAMQNTLALPTESANQTVSRLSAMDQHRHHSFVSGMKSVPIILHIRLSADHRAVKAGKCGTAAFTAVLAYMGFIYRGLLCRGRSALLYLCD